MEYLYQYLLFLAQAVTIAIVAVVIIGALGNLTARGRGEPERGYLQLTHLNDRLEEYATQLQASVLSKAEFKLLEKAHEKERKKSAKQEAQKRKQEAKGKRKVATGAEDAAAAELDGDGAPGKVFVIDFVGDLQASKVSHLRREVTAVLTTAKAQDEIVVRLESAGGVVHGYGLAASQLHRVREQGVALTVAIDKVAASGGYMMAAVANRIVAAPFAVVGSIGVVAQVPNVHRLLKRNDVDVDVLTAGKYKRTLTTMGENTQEGRDKFQQELEDTHKLFQAHISDYRPAINMDSVATGETWYGQEAVANNLVDEVSTSDSYLVRACEKSAVYQVKWIEQQKPMDRLLEQFTRAVNSLQGLSPFGRL